MNSNELQGIVRAIVSALAGALTSKGLIDSSQAESISGAVAIIVVAVWSIWHKRKMANSQTTVNPNNQT